MKTRELKDEEMRTINGGETVVNIDPLTVPAGNPDDPMTTDTTPMATNEATAMKPLGTMDGFSATTM